MSTTNPTDPGQCPRCSCEIKPGTEAAHALDGSCANTKAPTTRALADDLWLTRKDVAALDTKLSSYLRAANDGIVKIRHDFEARCKGLDGRVANAMEAIKSLDGIARVYDEMRKRMETRVEELERKHSDLDRRVEALYEPFDREANHENTGAAGRTPADTNGTQPAPTGNPVHAPASVVDGPGPVTNPASTHPYKLTDEELYTLQCRIDDWHTADPGSEAGDASHRVYEYVESLVTRAVRQGVEAELESLHAATEARLAEVTAERTKAVLALEGAWGHQKNLEADRDFLRAKLEQAERKVDALTNGVMVFPSVDEAFKRLPTGHGTVFAGREVRELDQECQSLRAKLDGVREKAKEAIHQLSVCAVPVEHFPGIESAINALKSALAAAENANTGSSTVERHAIAEPGKGQPDVKAAEGGDAGSIPAPCSTFSLSPEQREKLWIAASLRKDSSADEIVYSGLLAFIERLATSSRAGWVTREVAREACERYTQSPLRNEKQWNSWESCIANAERDAMWTNSLRSKANDKQDG